MSEDTSLPFPESLPDFQRLFPNDTACATYLERMRWRDGFLCPKCSERGDPYRFAKRPQVLRCRVCKRDVSLTAGTIMERTHSPLSTWFWAAYLVSTQMPGMSARQFGRQIGINRYETAFQILHKLRAAMVRPNADRIGKGKSVAHVEMDETLIGGVTRGEGKGVHHMRYVVGAVEACERAPVVDGKRVTKAMLRRAGTYAGRLRLRVLPDRTGILNFARESIAQGTIVHTDDYAGYASLDIECGLHHNAIAERGDRNVAERHLPLIHLVFSNLKSWLLGTHHSVSDHHLQAYLNEFTFRFNRRFYPFNGFRSLLGLGAVSESPTYDELYSYAWTHPVAAGPWELTG